MERLMRVRHLRRNRTGTSRKEYLEQEKKLLKKKYSHKETLNQTKITARTYQLCSVNRQEIGLERLEGIGCK